NYVFGEAESPGKAALISLYRLKPEFYGKKPNTELFIERSTKEAVHEIGHTLGLNHCSNPFCVMYFSNSIFETDRKQSLFCNKCYLKIENKPDENVEQQS
ncbi:MAG TPA: matrixin family metalloprotease, partial [Candidatus Bathyarchaeia archaeon]|nr:matrixin family metalloprotease [Candidatus Bathyarchaeia archaeon]